MAWVYVAIAGILEVVWAFSMKQSEGFTKVPYTLITLVTMIASFVLLSYAMKSLPLGTAYMVWTGIGALGAFIVGILFLNEPTNQMRILSAVLIAAGIVMMKLTESH